MQAQKEELKSDSKEKILVLLDIGGTICYRCSNKVQEISKKPDFVIKKHYHYFRPFYDDFIKSLIEHPRVRLGFYTSI